MQERKRELTEVTSDEVVTAMLSSMHCMTAEDLLTCHAKENLASLYVALLEGFLQKAALVKAPLSRDALVVSFLHSLLDQMNARKVLEDRVARKLKVFVYRGVLCGT